MKKPTIFVQTNFQYLIVDREDIDSVAGVEDKDNTYKIVMKNGTIYEVSITEIELFSIFNVKE